MKILNIYKNLFILILFITIFNLTSSKDAFAVDSNGHWIELSPMINSRAQFGIAKLSDGRILVTGGANYNTNQILKTSELFNPKDNSWSSTTSMNIPRFLVVDNHTLTFSDGNILVVGGESVGPVIPEKTTEIYNPKEGTWKYKADLNVARFHTALAPLPNDRALVFGGGYKQGGFLNSSEIFDYTENKWTLTDNLNIPRQLNTDFGILPDGRIIAVGGQVQEGDDFATNTAEIYDPSTEKWVLTSNLPFKFNHGTVTVLKNGNVLVVGSIIHNNPLTILKSAAVYNPGNDTWTPTEDMPTPRGEHYDYLLDDGNVLIFGGYGENYSLYTTTLIYNPTNNTWKNGPELPSFFRLGKTIELNNGDLLIAGSMWSNHTYNNVYLFTNGDTSSDYILDVPYFNQLDSSWGSDEYDFASSWNPRNPSISAWGCALTSAAMILKYYNYEKLPDGSDLNPGSLNTWLKNQKDGFIRNGLVNWEAIKRLSREAKGINNQDFTALDFEWIHNKNDSLLKENIENETPAILEIETEFNSSHFFVANGISDNTFNINDPAFTNKKLLSEYGNSYNSMRLFKPSYTDLSSIQVIINKGIDIKINPESGITNGFQANLYPIKNDQDNGVSGEILNSHYIHNPETGNYTISISSNNIQKYEINIYLYDKFANLKTKTFKGVLTKQSNNEFSVDFDKLNSEKSKIDRKRALGLDSGI